MENYLKENEDNIRNSKEKEIDKINKEKTNLINDSLNMMNQICMNSMNNSQIMENQININQRNMMDMDINPGYMNNMMNMMNMNMHQDNNNFDIEQMMQKMNMQSNDQISDEEKISDNYNGGIEVNFRNQSISLKIQCKPDEKVSDIIQRYRDKSGDNEPTKKFIFNAKALNPYLTVAEAGLANNFNIFVVSTKGIKGGGCPMMFTDISKNKTREIGFSKKAPSYRKVTKGINIFGICNFKKCKAYKKEVVVRIKKKKLDLIKERDELFCPECEAAIIPKTIGFYLCKFVIYGKKLEDDRVEPFRNEEDEANKKDSLKYFDPELNGEVMVTELIIEVLEYL